MLLAAIAGAACLGAAGWLGTIVAPLLVAEISSAADGPRPGTPPTAWLIGGSAVLGALLAPHAPAPQLGLVALVVFALAAAWCADVLSGIVPDICSLGPLAVLLFIGLVEHRWATWFSAFVLFVPFAGAALLSKGRGMGWGDVKLAALGGAALGAPVALLLFAFASAAAVIVNRVTGPTRVPIAFAPYLVAAIGVGLTLGAFI